MNKQKGFSIVELIVPLFILAGIGGWIANIVKLAYMSFDVLTGMAVLRIVGIFVPPVGAVLGYI